MSYLEVQFLRCASAFVTQRTFVRLAPQALRALNLKLFSLPSNDLRIFLCAVSFLQMEGLFFCPSIMIQDSEK